MSTEPEQRAVAPFLQALATCTDHLDDLEVFEVCTRGGEAELNDLLRHATNRIVRPHQIVQREQTRPDLISRADLMLTDTGSGGMVWAVIEAKMVFSTDVIDARPLWEPKLVKDIGKLTRMRGPNPPPAFLLTWMPHFATLHRPLRYMRGHTPTPHGHNAIHDITTARQTLETWLDRHGNRAPRVTVRDAQSIDGHVILDAYLTAIPTESTAL